jgi:hypothetical protein
MHFSIGPLEGRSFKLRKMAPHRGYVSVSWGAGAFYSAARDEERRVVTEFGSTPAEGAEKLLFYMGLNTFLLSDD